MINLKINTGLEQTLSCPIIAADINGCLGKALVAVPTEAVCSEIATNLRFFVGDIPVIELEEEEHSFVKFFAKSHEGETKRLRALAALADEDSGRVVVVAPISAIMRKTAAPSLFRDSIIRIKVGEQVDMTALSPLLLSSGYVRTPYAQVPGEYAIRGGIIDVFPYQDILPYRIELLGDQVESLHCYDAESQKSIKGSECQEVTLVPFAGPVQGTGSHVYSMADYLGENDNLMIVDPGRMESIVKLRDEEARADFVRLLALGEVCNEDFDDFVSPAALSSFFDRVCRARLSIYVGMGSLPEAFRNKDAYTKHFTAKHPAALYGQLDLLSSEIKSYLRRSFYIAIICGSDERLDRLADFLAEEGLSGKVELRLGELTSGVEICGEGIAPEGNSGIVYLWDGDIFRQAKKSRSRLKTSENIDTFSDINPGDYVVHDKHGIGIYKGIKQVCVDDNMQDYITIAYTGKDVLYIPATQMGLVQKYIATGEKKPRVSRLGVDDWTRTKERVRLEIELYAKDLIELAARRKLAKGFAFSEDTPWQKNFSDGFPYEPTDDQHRCFAAVTEAMERPYPMDMLICGDVGYGKTEVALRAVFKCTMDGKQAAILVPTTILAAQHFHTFADRFKDFPQEVAVLSRFQSTAEQRKIYERLSSGEIDVVVGTHKLLSDKVRFKDLGLLVIDEEQRFGVRHKEKIRSLEAGADILTLTATPIPRTLNMALLGIRDLAILNEPPEFRHPIRTYVSEENDEVITESIRREIDRGGQVYVVFNRIHGIEEISHRIRGLVPGVRLAVCHGKMNESALDEIMMAWGEGDYDILLSTTIIESGLDFPNVNTVLIMDADRLGLTQLYQIRGRVGRSSRIAFAYLLYRSDKIITETAEKRLSTIREWTEFGSGFKIAMKDLEIRGAGNLLGIKQSGHMTAVGYELYCRMMDEAVKNMVDSDGDAAKTDAHDIELEFSVPALVPTNYIDDEIVKLSIYKRIAAVKDEAEKDALTSELTDRFGSMPQEVHNLIDIGLTRALGSRSGFSTVGMKAGFAYFIFAGQDNIDPKKIYEISRRFESRIEVLLSGRARIELSLASTSPRDSFAEIIEILKLFVV